MIRLVLSVFLIIAASVIYGYFHELNPGTITLRLNPAEEIELRPVTLILLSMALGAFIVTLLVGVHATRDLVVNWQGDRLRRRDEKVEALHQEGTQAFLSKRNPEAISLFRKALAIDPNHVDSLLWLGNVYRADKNFAEAIRLHRKARGIDEKNVEVLLGLEKDLETAGRFEEAQQVLQDILRFDSANLTALLRRRDLYMRLEKWQDALEVQERIVKEPLSMEDRPLEAGLLVGIRYEVGRQFLERGQFDKARRFFRGAMKRDKTFLPAYIGLGEVLIREGKVKNAAEILEKVYRRTRSVIILHRLEELYLEMGEPGEAIRVYQEAIQADPHNAVLKFYLGKLYYRLEMVDEAFDILAVLEGPQDQLSDYHKILANLYLRKQQMELAIEELKKALGFKERVVVPYACTECRYESVDWAGRCLSCGRWNTLEAMPWVDHHSGVPMGDRINPVMAPHPGANSPFETV
jgi:lipopolysaccharide biosynthesis regulator YciM